MTAETPTCEVRRSSRKILERPERRLEGAGKAAVAVMDGLFPVIEADGNGEQARVAKIARDAGASAPPRGEELDRAIRGGHPVNSTMSGLRSGSPPVQPSQTTPRLSELAR